jgi:hypothetical protein
MLPRTQISDIKVAPTRQLATGLVIPANSNVRERPPAFVDRVDAQSVS